MSQVVIRLLPDGSGRVRIHYFVHDQKGPVTTPSGAVMTALGPLKLGGVTGRIACQPQLASVTPQMVKGELQPTVHSDDVRAVTCPECQRTSEYLATMNLLAHTMPVTNPVA